MIEGFVASLNAPTCGMADTMPVVLRVLVVEDNEDSREVNPPVVSCA